MSGIHRLVVQAFRSVQKFNERHVYGLLEFTVVLEAFRNHEKQQVHAWPTVIDSCTGSVYKS